MEAAKKEAGCRSLAADGGARRIRPGAFDIWESPIGPYLVAADDTGITEVSRLRPGDPALCAPECDPQGRTPLSAEGARPGAVRLIRECEAELGEYFDGRRKSFDVPLALKGTEFRLAVWRALQDIPYGETRSYGAVAEALGRPGAARAVGAANHANPVSIIVPCHRVIGADGSLTGYGGGLDAKEYLLKLERSVRQALCAGN